MNSVQLPSFFFYYSDVKGKEKFSIGPIAENTHLTFHFGTKSKVFDIHITRNGEKKEHETLLEIKHFTLYRLFILFNRKVLPYLYKKFYTDYINLGKLKKYDCYLQPANLNNIDSIFKISSNQHRIRLKKQIDNSILNDWLVYAEDFVLRDDCYFVFRNRKGYLVQNGVLYKRLDKNISKSYIYLSQRKFRKMIRTTRNAFFKLLKEIDRNTYEAIKDNVNKHS